MFGHCQSVGGWITPFAAKKLTDSISTNVLSRYSDMAGISVLPTAIEGPRCMRFLSAPRVRHARRPVPPACSPDNSQNPAQGPFGWDRRTWVPPQGVVSGILTPVHTADTSSAIDRRSDGLLPVQICGNKGAAGDQLRSGEVAPGVLSIIHQKAWETTLWG